MATPAVNALITITPIEPSAFAGNNVSIPLSAIFAIIQNGPDPNSCIVYTDRDLRQGNLRGNMLIVNESVSALSTRIANLTTGPGAASLIILTQLQNQTYPLPFGGGQITVPAASIVGIFQNGTDGGSSVVVLNNEIGGVRGSNEIVCSETVAAITARYNALQ